MMGYRWFQIVMLLSSSAVIAATKIGRKITSPQSSPVSPQKGNDMEEASNLFNYMEDVNSQQFVYILFDDQGFAITRYVADSDQQFLACCPYELLQATDRVERWRAELPKLTFRLKRIAQFELED